MFLETFSVSFSIFCTVSCSSLPASVKVTVGGAIEFFAKSAGLEAPRGIRINVVSPTILEESVPVYGDLFPGFSTVSGKEIAKSYQRSVIGLENGHTFKCFAGNS